MFWTNSEDSIALGRPLRDPDAHPGMPTSPRMSSSDDRGLRQSAKGDRLKKIEPKQGATPKTKKRMCVQGVGKGALADDEMETETSPVPSALNDLSDSTVTPESERKDSETPVPSGFDALRHLCDVSLMMKQANCSPAPEEISPGESEESY
eukprot:3387545-Rhodomonas_salina.1